MKFFLNLFVYLAVLVFSCGMQTLRGTKTPGGTIVSSVPRYFLADKLVTHITIEQFLPKNKPKIGRASCRERV